MTVYRIRRDLAALLVLPIPILTAAISLVLITTQRPVLVVLAVVYVVVSVVLMIRMYRQARRRTLTVSDTSLVVQRDAYRIGAPWSEVVGIDRKRRQGLLADELVLASPVVTFVDAADKPTRVPKAAAGHPALQRIQVSFYDKNWREGPIGDRLRSLLQPSS
ncbi:hypothetical protein ACH47X_08280 [Promicromonospora kroppenstedtii]|uniref:PH domain-containing protein n=1 Tax=Promicromonospora kroppenstedtii TaxID=440482 RepID=A0ABW7XH99_9MICO